MRVQNESVSDVHEVIEVLQHPLGLQTHILLHLVDQQNHEHWTSD